MGFPARLHWASSRPASTIAATVNAAERRPPPEAGTPSANTTRRSGAVRTTGSTTIPIRWSLQFRQEVGRDQPPLREDLPGHLDRGLYEQLQGLPERPDQYDDQSRAVVGHADRGIEHDIRQLSRHDLVHEEHRVDRGLRDRGHRWIRVPAQWPPLQPGDHQLDDHAGDHGRLQLSQQHQSASDLRRYREMQVHL